MNIFKTLLFSLCLPLISLQAFANADSQYRLSSGDVIKISVFGEADLSLERVRLNDAGAFSYPFLGEIRALNMTATELENELKRGLEGDFLINPNVSVSILEYREFFITGEVRNAGGYPFQPGMTLRQAAAMAGGLTERASQRRMTIIRDGDTSRTPERATMDTPVNPGDIIQIDQGFF
ncbi:polysaccharide biosynthesis/export family protein [Nitrincola nitratireducens]|uniref:Polysaccharide export protein Wza n=1 Tax=Nitrincola nitratireducens TaxID=1229521 RepID=W9VJP6_9GAMM|nr:polysaccharide biosynthesis/export family protein [Nitrincola nitratireducens]EXJ10790.1 polysaccharide export protein Wza [Nitrincola nitratireducens]